MPQAASPAAGTLLTEDGALVGTARLEVLSDGLALSVSDNPSDRLAVRLSDGPELSDGLLLSVTVSGSGLPPLCAPQPVNTASPISQPTAARIRYLRRTSIAPR
jgi:hypothetical protein